MCDDFHADYAVGAQIGSGSFSVVYRVTYLPTGEQLAAKVVRADEQGFNPEEGRIALGLHHRNIVRTHALFETERRHVLVMDLVQGGDAFSLTRERMPEVRVRQLLGQLLSALSFLHARGIVHRDVKLENMLMDGDHLRLIDFGFAKVVGAGRSLSSCCGSPNYMAPEMLRASRSQSGGGLKTRYSHYGQEVDLWAAGVVMYVLLVGQYPFFDENRSKWHKRILTAAYNAPIDGSVSDEGLDLLRKLLDTDPATRISAADALRHPFVASNADCDAAGRAADAGCSWTDEVGVAEGVTVKTPSKRMVAATRLHDFTPPTNHHSLAQVADTP